MGGGFRGQIRGHKTGCNCLTLNVTCDIIVKYLTFLWILSSISLTCGKYSFFLFFSLEFNVMPTVRVIWL